MSEPLRALDQTETSDPAARWTFWLVTYVRALAGIWMLKGLYHWALVCGVFDRGGSSFEAAPIAWKAATIFFAVIDLVAAVGLWLAAAWGGVVWLTSAISMAAVEVFFPQIYGGQLWIVAIEIAAVGAYLSLTVLAARERAE